MNSYVIEIKNGKKHVVKCERVYKSPVKENMNTYVIEEINGKKHVVKKTGATNDWR